MKNIFSFGGFILSLNLFAAECPTNNLKGFDGTFKGVLSPVNFQGERQPLENIDESHSVKNCSSFDFDVRYSNPQTGVQTREVKFSGQWNKSKKAYVLKGEILEGLLHVKRPGQYLLSFDTKFAGNSAHCEEMITLTSDAKQVIRSVHCFAGGIDGQSLGVRSALASRTL